MTRFTAIYGTKGGVGKSTIAVNVAYALSGGDAAVALVDLDLSGPNVQNLVAGVAGQPPSMEKFRIQPGTYGGVDIVGIGFFVEPHDAGLLTGKYLEGALEQIVFHRNWHGYDHVIIDMPPGFGELHQHVFGRLPVEVAMVTTPHTLSTQDLARGRRLLEHVGVPVLGYIENMSGYRCEHCGERARLFATASDGVLDSLELLGRVPFLPATYNPDSGIPLILAEEQGAADFRRAIHGIVRNMNEQGVSNGI